MGDARVERLETLVCTVPTDAPDADGTLARSSTTVVVVLAHSGGHVGTGWTYGRGACAPVVRDLLTDVMVGTDVLAVPGTWEAMARAARNATRAGAVGYAISAVDVALWDLKAHQNAPPRQGTVADPTTDDQHRPGRPGLDQPGPP